MHKIITTSINPNLLPPTKAGDFHLVRPAFSVEARAIKLLGDELQSQVTDPHIARLFSLMLDTDVQAMDPAAQVPLLQPGDLVFFGEPKFNALTTTNRLEASCEVDWQVLEVYGEQTWGHVIDLLERADLELQLFANTNPDPNPDLREEWEELDRNLWLSLLKKSNVNHRICPFLVEKCPDGLYIHRKGKSASAGTKTVEIPGDKAFEETAVEINCTCPICSAK